MYELHLPSCPSSSPDIRTEESSSRIAMSSGFKVLVMVEKLTLLGMYTVMFTSQSLCGITSSSGLSVLLLSKNPSMNRVPFASGSSETEMSTYIQHLYHPHEIS